LLTTASATALDAGNQGQADVAPVAVADDHVDLVLLDEALGGEHGLGGLAARVVEREVDAPAAEPALLVGLLDEELDGPSCSRREGRGPVYEKMLPILMGPLGAAEAGPGANGEAAERGELPSREHGISCAPRYGAPIGDCSYALARRA
jgi:hypothetical protein